MSNLLFLDAHSLLLAGFLGCDTHVSFHVFLVWIAIFMGNNVFITHKLAALHWARQSSVGLLESTDASGSRVSFHVPCKAVIAGETTFCLLYNHTLEPTQDRLNKCRLSFNLSFQALIFAHQFKCQCCYARAYIAICCTQSFEGKLSSLSGFYSCKHKVVQFFRIIMLRTDYV